MDIGRVVGSVVSTAKTPGLEGRTLLVVQPVAPTEEPSGAEYVAVDRVGAGTGQLVLVVRGSSARVAVDPGDVEVDAAVVAIVDRIDLAQG